MTWYRTITMRDITLPLKVELEKFGFGYNWMVTVDSGLYAGRTYTHYSTSNRAYHMDMALENAANEITYAITGERITVEEYTEAVTPDVPETLDTPGVPTIPDIPLDDEGLDLSIIIIAVIIVVIIIVMWLA